MSRFSVIGWWQAAARPFRSPRKARRPGESPRRVRILPRLEALEDRVTPSTLTVLNNADSGSGSLRAAIAAAHSGDTIVFAHSVHDIKLTSGQLAVTKSLTIDGPGANQLTISGNDASRVFDVSNGASVTIDGVTIADGATVGSRRRRHPQRGRGHPDPRSGCVVTDNTATASPPPSMSSAAVCSTRAGHRRLLHLQRQPGAGRRRRLLLRRQRRRRHRQLRRRQLTVTDSTFINNQAIGARRATSASAAPSRTTPAWTWRTPRRRPSPTPSSPATLAGGGPASPATAAPSTTRALGRP